ncbi:hypothetical protein M408DRAFT_25342 [Serendipita vermifera MAFF 305830]|uniref:Uncharacterized protein n=1 Tax=Serendipita vermifera MAFF 305830 TaxID=933852 RepID=A0A0C3AP68_SERVB|nr:hypothetical protein M408DRAFT_27862 [Serendipita vermifera MAFF 305830]KIM26370.1 hypothetical protein M408DRAFT_25342 [Serendipita vermifera MAFF 305830]
MDFFSQPPTVTTFTLFGTGAYTVEPAYNEFYYQDPSTGAPVPITATVSSSYTAKLAGELKSRHYEHRIAKRHAARSLAKRSTLGKRDIAVTNCASSFKNDVVLFAHANEVPGVLRGSPIAMVPYES